MRILKFIKKIITRYYDIFFKNTIFTYSKQKRKEIIDSFPEPKNRIERSFFQYKCQNYETNKIVMLLLNIISYPIIWILIIKSFFKKSVLIEKKDAIYLSDGIDSFIIPKVLFDEYKEIDTVVYTSRLIFQNEERVFINKIKNKYQNQGFFILKCALKIGLYKGYIMKYNPSAIITYNEYSFTSSILTDYCESQGILHINVLHGEHLYNIRDTFVSFSRFYVWNEEYKKLFISMRAEPRQFYVEMPLKFSRKLPIMEISYDLTYYLADEDYSNLKEIKYYLDLLRKKNKKICIRMHPRCGNRNIIFKLFEGYNIEESLKVDLLVSFAKTKFICSLISTTLYEAKCYGKNIVIDDCTNKKKYNLVKELGYVLLKEKHVLLSQYINEN